MPKLVCPCGFVHDLSPIPDEGFQVIRDKDMESFIGHTRAYQDGFDAAPGTPGREASDRALREQGQLVGLLYDCPKCKRIMWRKTRGGDYQIYVPENPLA